LAYAVVAWMAMQIGEVTFEAIHLPGWSLTLLIFLLLLGFPVALVIAWAFEVTPKGIRKDTAGDLSRDNAGASWRRSEDHSIAVLPFYDTSELGDQGFFCEGLAEEILNSLCRIENLHVVSRFASFRFGAKKGNVQKIGRELRVNNVLIGTVRKSRDRLRITVELVDTADGFDLWSGQYDRKIDDLFAIQRDIAESIAAVLRLTLDEAAVDSMKCAPGVFEWILRGNSLVARRTLQGVVRARQLYHRAIKLDEECGRAWEGLASTYGYEYLLFNATELNREKMLEASQRAVKLAPERSDTHVMLGVAHVLYRNFGLAEAEFNQALEIDPDHFEACYFFARTCVRQGRLEDALELFRRAARINREDYQSVLLQAQILVSLGREDEAREISLEGVRRARRILVLNPDDNRALSLGAFALLRLGEKRLATKWMKKSIRNSPDDPVVQYNAACFYSLSGDQERAIRCLENCHFKVGEIDRDWLENDSDLDNIRNHARFAEVIESITGSVEAVS
jgi:TolB-like protein/Flp pilus assembly protein TadD